MARSVYFDNCIAAIRHTTFGRDNRKPIADSISEAKDEHSDLVPTAIENWRFADIDVEAIAGSSEDYTLIVNPLATGG